MKVHIGFTTPTSSIGCSSFTTSEESIMDEHKTTSLEEDTGAKMKVVDKNAYEDSKDSQPSLCEN